MVIIINSVQYEQAGKSNQKHPVTHELRTVPSTTRLFSIKHTVTPREARFCLDNEFM